MPNKKSKGAAGQELSLPAAGAFSTQRLEADRAYRACTRARSAAHARALIDGRLAVYFDRAGRASALARRAAHARILIYFCSHSKDLLSRQIFGRQMDILRLD